MEMDDYTLLARVSWLQSFDASLDLNNPLERDVHETLRAVIEGTASLVRRGLKNVFTTIREHKDYYIQTSPLQWVWWHAEKDIRACWMHVPSIGMGYSNDMVTSLLREFVVDLWEDPNTVLKIYTLPQWTESDPEERARCLSWLRQVRLRGKYDLAFVKREHGRRIMKQSRNFRILAVEIRSAHQ